VGVYLLVTCVAATGFLTAPVAIGAASSISVLIGHGVYEISRGIVEPSASEARSVPAPYLSTMMIIVASKGNLEVAGAYNAITSAVTTVGRVIELSAGDLEITDPELAKLILDLVKTGYVNPPWVLGLGTNAPSCPSRQETK